MLSRSLALWHRWRARLRAALWRAQLGRAALGAGVGVAAGARVLLRGGGRLVIGAGTQIDRDAQLQVLAGRLEIGPGGHVGPGAILVARHSIVIGRDVLIAEYVTLRDQDHRFGLDPPTARNGFVTAPIRLGDNVWLGAKVTVLKGVTIGNNVIVGANSVVSRDLPDNVVAVGAPARVIRRLAAPEPRR